MVDAGGSDAFWPNGYKWALRTAGTGWIGSKNRSNRMPWMILWRCAATRRCRSPAARCSRRRSSCRPDVRCGAARCHEGRRHRGAADRLDGAGVWHPLHPARLEHRLAWPPISSSAFPDTDLVEYITGSAYVDKLTVEGFQLDDDGMLAIPDRPGSV